MVRPLLPLGSQHCVLSAQVAFPLPPLDHLLLFFRLALQAWRRRGLPCIFISTECHSHLRSSLKVAQTRRHSGALTHPVLFHSFWSWWQIDSLYNFIFNSYAIFMWHSLLCLIHSKTARSVSSIGCHLRVMQLPNGMLRLQVFMQGPH